jgi:hypothetical protein
MGLFDAVKRAFNIGGCRLTIKTNSQAYPQGSLVEGEVRLEGGGLDQVCNSMCIELEEFWTESRGSGKSRRRVTVYRTREKQVLGKNLSILPGDSSTYEFSLKLPANSRLSTSSTGWRLKVSLDIPDAFDPCGTLNLKVTGANEFKAVSAACTERLQMREKDNSWKWDNSRSTYFRMLPSEEMGRDFDYIAFSLMQVERTGGVRGKIIFNLQEKSFLDYLKAMFLMDRIEKPLVLSGEQLFCSDGSVNSNAIQGVIGPLIREIVQAGNQYEINQKPEINEKNLSSKSSSNSGNLLEKKQKDFDPRKLDDYCKM